MATTKKKTTLKAKSKKTTGKNKAAVKASSRKSSVKTVATGGGNSASKSFTQQVVEYKLFVEDSVRNLEDQVNYHISKGWAPVGGVVLQGQSNYLQTMVRQGR